MLIANVYELKCNFYFADLVNYFTAQFFQIINSTYLTKSLSLCSFFLMQLRNGMQLDAKTS